MRLTLNVTTICQILAWVVALLTATADAIPLRWRATAAAVVAGASLVLHQLAGRRNPDSSTAEQAYLPDVASLVAAAEAAYEAYRAHTGGKSLISGSPIPEWGQLPEAIQQAWQAAAGAKAAK
jgi:hypothetical protein